MVNKLELYFLLSTRSKRAFKRIKTKWGQPYIYNPRGDLLKNLSNQTGKNIEDVRKQLIAERYYYIKTFIIDPQKT